MSDVKAEFPIGKTQWSKWGSDARNAFNDMRRKGFEFNVAVGEANAVQEKHKSGGLLGVLKDVADVATEVAEVVTSVTPVVAVAKTVVKAAKGKKGK